MYSITVHILKTRQNFNCLLANMVYHYLKTLGYGYFRVRTFPDSNYAFLILFHVYNPPSVNNLRDLYGIKYNTAVAKNIYLEIIQYGQQFNMTTQLDLQYKTDLLATPNIGSNEEDEKKSST